VDSAPLVNAIGFGLIAQQGLAYYVYPTGAGIVGQGWTHLAGHGLVAGDFVPATGYGGALDFSAAAGPIVFGYYTANGGSGTNAHLEAAGGVDNFSLVVNSVPEPGLMGVLAVGGLMVRRRR
jgi:hypothetical protein